MDTSLLDSKSPTRVDPRGTPRNGHHRIYPGPLSQHDSQQIRTYLNLSKVRTARVSKGMRSRTIAAGDEHENGPKYQLVRRSIDWEQFAWKPTLKELASTREYRLTRWIGVRVGRSPDKSIGKTLSTGEWTDLILGRVRLEEEYEALKQYT
jgi:hypothetical protein